MKENHLYYQSTRGDNQKVVLSAEAIIQGMAKDGGLFVPVNIPRLILNQDFSKVKNIDYQTLAYLVMKEFFTDYQPEELIYSINQAYDSKFDSKAITPLCPKMGVYFLELFHGPTLAFKDLALSLLPHLLKKAVQKLGLPDKEIVILTATSGDTGKAALQAFANVEGTKIIVFFPHRGVSKIQERQMLTQEGENTLVIGLRGNFDDAQRGVKEIFEDPVFNKGMGEKGYLFSSANSINIGRLVPQVVYYFSAYGQMLSKGEIQKGEKINVVVPTGNFGNILAAFYAKEMGLPINRLICASNENKVLTDFFRSGVYDRRRELISTISPSMDILVSSNLERWLWSIHGKEAQKVKELMESLRNKGFYQITDTVAKQKLEDFYGEFASQEECRQSIKEVFEESKYLLDPHTAVAFTVYQKYRKETQDYKTKTVIAATASPFKFTKSVMESLDSRYQEFDDFALIKEMSDLIEVPVPVGIKDIEKRPIQHPLVCKKEEMKAEIAKFLA